MNNAWLRDTICDFEPYKVPEIKENTVINANESPYNIFDFPNVKVDFLSRLEKRPLYHYPNPFAEELRTALGEYVSRRADEILVGNGGDEIISLILNTFMNAGDTLLIHTPTFDVYEIDGQVLGANVVKVPDLEGFKRDRNTFLRRVTELRPKITMLCNPNNPTGELLPLSFLEEVLKASSNPVVIDEAYLEFSGQESIISQLDQYDNLIVIRTLSKAFGLAGMRIGYAVAQQDVIAALSLTKLVYNMNNMSQLLGLSAMAYRDEILQHNIPPTIQGREYLMAALRKLDGVTVYPSVTNFVLVHVPDGPAMVRALSQADICVRFYKAPELENCLRITVTTMDVIRRVISVFQREVVPCAALK